MKTIFLISIPLFCCNAILGGGQKFASHPPLRTVRHVSQAQLGNNGGPSFFVCVTGDDAAPGTEAKPWRTISHALTKLRPGDTLYLRAGVYRENISIALAGEPEKPITISGYPGEEAILDGSYAEFFETPESAWEPASQKIGNGEFRSTGIYPNLRNVLGSFGDSLIGLQTYYHAKDLRAAKERVDWENWENRDTTDLKPLYLGPGIWYDRKSSRIHIRLLPTNLPDPIPNYRGESDPRKLPLLLAPFRSTPLKLDGARHLIIRDLSVRGAGYAAVETDQAAHITFENVVVWCGTYGLRASGTRHLKIHQCGFYGNVAPWTFRGDGSKRDYPGRPHRNLSRLNTHAVIEIDSGRESSVYAFPQNDHWEISNSEFTDAHDGVYLGGINLRFHHNLIENMQDDGIYLSPMYLRHRLDGKDPQLFIGQNVFRQILTPLAFGGPWPETSNRIFIYRNVFDLRGRVQTGRPSTKESSPRFSTGKLMGDHGSPPWPAMNIYHNTIVTLDRQRRADGSALGGLRSGNPRRVFNNLFLHLSQLPGLIPPKGASDLFSDGNLYWSIETAQGVDKEMFFGRFRAAAKESEQHSLMADPQFQGDPTDLKKPLDCRLSPGSPAIDAGVSVPQVWPDPLRQTDRGKPDIGATPIGGSLIEAGKTNGI